MLLCLFSVSAITTYACVCRHRVDAHVVLPGYLPRAQTLRRVASHWTMDALCVFSNNFSLSNEQLCSQKRLLISLSIVRRGMSCPEIGAGRIVTWKSGDCAGPAGGARGRLVAARDARRRGVLGGGGLAPHLPRGERNLMPALVLLSHSKAISSVVEASCGGISCRAFGSKVSFVILRYFQVFM